MEEKTIIWGSLAIANVWLATQTLHPIESIIVSGIFIFFAIVMVICEFL